MAKRFLLECETVHCFGRKSYLLDETSSPEKAKSWVEEKRKNYKRSQLPEEEQIRSCPVVHCPFKQQKPIFSFKEVDR